MYPFERFHASADFKKTGVRGEATSARLLLMENKSTSYISNLLYALTDDPVDWMMAPNKAETRFGGFILGVRLAREGTLRG